MRFGVDADVKKTGAAWKAIVGVGFMGFAATVAGAASAEVKEANATCYTATAILLPGDGSNEDVRLSLIRNVLNANPNWTKVDAIPENRVGDVAVVKYDVKSPAKGGPTVVYTVACGHGGTCNDVAKKFDEKHPEIQPDPVVVCGDLSHVLSNPQIMTK